MMSFKQAIDGSKGDIYGNGVVRLSPNSGMPHAAREGVDLASVFVGHLQELVDSGVSQFSLQIPRGDSGILHVRPNAQLNLPEYAQTPSGDFCVLAFVTSPGRFVQFEIDLIRGVVTVARKPTIKDGKLRGYLACLAHAETMNLLSELVHQARLQVMHQQVEASTAVHDPVRQTHKKVRGALGV